MTNHLHIAIGLIEMVGPVRTKMGVMYLREAAKDLAKELAKDHSDEVKDLLAEAKWMCTDAYDKDTALSLCKAAQSLLT